MSRHGVHHGRAAFDVAEDAVEDIALADEKVCQLGGAGSAAEEQQGIGLDPQGEQDFVPVDAAKRIVDVVAAGQQRRVHAKENGLIGVGVQQRAVGVEQRLPGGIAFNHDRDSFPVEND